MGISRSECRTPSSTKACALPFTERGLTEPSRFRFATRSTFNLVRPKFVKNQKSNLLTEMPLRPLRPVQRTMPPRRCKTKVSASSTEKKYSQSSWKNSDCRPVPHSQQAPPPPASVPLPTCSARTSGDVLPAGFPAEHNMSYRNATLLLMNTTPIVRYLDQISTRREQASDTVFVELGEMAVAYWSPGSDQERRNTLGGILDKLWAHLLYLNYDDLPKTAGWGPFLDFEQRETQQDAADFLENLLHNGNAQCQYRG